MTTYCRNAIITIKLTFLDVQLNVLFEVTSYLKIKAVTEIASTLWYSCGCHWSTLY